MLIIFHEQTWLSFSIWFSFTVDVKETWIIVMICKHVPQHLGILRHNSVLKGRVKYKSELHAVMGKYLNYFCIFFSESSAVISLIGMCFYS